MFTSRNWLNEVEVAKNKVSIIRLIQVLLQCKSFQTPKLFTVCVQNAFRVLECRLEDVAATYCLLGLQAKMTPLLVQGRLQLLNVLLNKSAVLVMRNNFVSADNIHVCCEIHQLIF